MIPVWMKEKDTYQPQAGGDNPYLKKTIKKIAQVILTIQQESPASLGFSMPVIPKLLLNLTAIVVISVSRNRLILLLLFAIVQSFLALNPEVLILDEPLAGLDAKSQMCFIELFRELKQAGKTIIAATHEDELQRQLGDKLLML